MWGYELPEGIKRIFYRIMIKKEIDRIRTEMGNRMIEGLDGMSID